MKLIVSFLLVCSFFSFDIKALTQKQINTWSNILYILEKRIDFLEKKGSQFKIEDHKYKDEHGEELQYFKGKLESFKKDLKKFITLFYENYAKKAYTEEEQREDTFSHAVVNFKNFIADFTREGFFDFRDDFYDFSEKYENFLNNRSFT